MKNARKPLRFRMDPRRWLIAVQWKIQESRTQRSVNASQRDVLKEYVEREKRDIDTRLEALHLVYVTESRNRDQ